MLTADWDRSADALQWAPDGRSLYVTAQDVGQTRLFAGPLASFKRANWRASLGAWAA